MSGFPARSVATPLTGSGKLRAQRGLSLLGLLVIAALVAMAATLALKVAPTVNEYLAIKRAIVKSRADGIDARSIRNVFERVAAVDDITAIDGKDLIVERLPSGEYSISFDYEKRVEMFGPVSLVIHYKGATGNTTADRARN
jgi:hypothetical protein